MYFITSDHDCLHLHQLLSLLKLKYALQLNVTVCRQLDGDSSTFYTCFTFPFVVPLSCLCALLFVHVPVTVKVHSSEGKLKKKLTVLMQMTKRAF